MWLSPGVTLCVLDVIHRRLTSSASSAGFVIAISVWTTNTTTMEHGMPPAGFALQAIHRLAHDDDQDLLCLQIVDGVWEAASGIRDSSAC